MENIFQANGHEKKAGVAIIRENRVQNKDHNKIQRRSLQNIKGAVQQDDITLVKIHTPHIRAPECKEKLGGL